MLSSLLHPALQGFLLGASLIIAIGAQNAFVLRQGLLRKHVFALALFCALSDALLIVLGVGGFGKLVQSSPLFLSLITWGGGAFLIMYGMKALYRAAHPQSLRVEKDSAATLGANLLKAAAFTFLNPHVYLDTVVLLGGLSARFAGIEKLAYGAGAAIASFVWFFALGYGARLLAPVFARPTAWRVLDLLIAGVMFFIAFSLLKPAVLALFP